ncbi:MAG: PPC domain-containing protein [Cyanobacteria bacterium P01_A01_bin.123]
MFKTRGQVYKTGMRLGLIAAVIALAGVPLMAAADETALLEIEGVLEAGDDTLGDGSLYDLYPFDAEAEQTITIQMASEEFDTYLLLVDEEGQTIGENDDVSESDTNSALTITLPEAGTYVVVANAFDNTGQGNYSLIVSEGSTPEVQIPETEEIPQEDSDLLP